jgi:hypothetical protein
MPINLKDIGNILLMTTLGISFLWFFSADMPFTPVVVMLLLTVAAYSCSEIT